MTVSQESQPLGPHGVEGLVGWILWGGVSLSVLCLGAGLLWQAASAGGAGFEQALPRTSFFRFAVAELGGLFREGITPGRLTNLGILALLLTPYVRVIFSMVHFVFVERNYKYGLITGFVGAFLTYSLLLT